MIRCGEITAKVIDNDENHTFSHYPSVKITQHLRTLYMVGETKLLYYDKND
jgi:hypothetical protein